MLDWDDLRYFLAAVEAGSYLGGAKALGVNRTTVGRRVEALEKCIGSPLFKQTASGYHPIDVGIKVLKCAKQLEKHVAQLSTALVNHQGALQGHVRVAVAAELGSDLLAEILRFQRNHGEVTVEVSSVRDPVTALTQRKADIALGALRAKPEYLAGQCLGRLSLGVYGAAQVSRHGMGAQDTAWVGWSEDMQGCLLASLMASHVGEDARTVSWVDCWAALKAATLAGSNVALMWQAFAETDPGLVRLPGLLPGQGQGADLWLLSLEAIPLDACKKAMCDFLFASLRQTLAAGPGFTAAGC